MKTTIVPAQITTVEDKVAGNLSFTQLLLLVTPVFVDGVIFVLLPPIFNFSFLKLILGIALALMCMTLAIRIKGKILLTWIAVIARYKLRPKHYLFNKNDMYLRVSKQQFELVPKMHEQTIVSEEVKAAPPFIPTSELVRIESAVDDPRMNFHFKVRKGGLRVHIRKVKEEVV